MPFLIRPVPDKIIDLAHPIGPNTSVYPGDPGLIVNQLSSVDSNGYALSEWHVNFHTGTHIDAPSHFFINGGSIQTLGLTLWMGNAWIIPCADQKIIGLDCIDTNLFSLEIDFLIFKTGWESTYDTPLYYSDHPQFTVELGQWLAASSIKGIGMDMPSPDRAPYPIHHLVLGADKVLIENLRNLNKLPENKMFQLICIPLPIEAEAVWVRPLAILP
ncbi:MAG: cyclase family protein [Saprospiraceae bacterium]|nr:cyclase family protein [Saprospiraceae bacterium]